MRLCVPLSYKRTYPFCSYWPWLFLTHSISDAVNPVTPLTQELGAICKYMLIKGLPRRGHRILLHTLSGSVMPHTHPPCKISLCLTSKV